MISKLTRGFLDGALSTLGVVIGASSASPSVVVAAGLGGALANAASNILGAFAADSIEEYSELRTIERAMVVKDLKGTQPDLSRRGGPVLAGIQDGFGTLAGGTMPVIPYLFLDTFPAMLTATAVVAAGTFAFGFYVGTVSKRNVIAMAARTTLLAVAVAVVVYVVERVIAGGLR